MGFYFRKSFGKGPFRTTLSNRGVSISVGGKGGRIGYYASKKKTSKKKVSKKTFEAPSNTSISEPVRLIYTWLALSILMFIPSLLLCLPDKTRLVGICGLILSVIEFITFKKNKRLNEKE